MNYYLSAPETIFKPVREILTSDSVRRNYLISFAGSVKHFDKFYNDGQNQIMIDSGAFSAWNSGKHIDREEYLAFCKKLPEDVFKINLDVIPVTGSSQSEKLKCIEKSFENYLYLKSHLKNVLPVHHYGEDVSWAKKMLNETDYICISPANDTHENIKREYFDYIFSEIDIKTKMHVLGYSSVDGVEKYPFYSVDSISYKKTHMHGQVYFKRTDGSIIDLDISDYAKLKGFLYDSRKGLASQPELLTSATYDTIMNLISHFERIGQINQTKDFSYLKRQLNLFSNLD